MSTSQEILTGKVVRVRLSLCKSAYAHLSFQMRYSRAIIQVKRMLCTEMPCHIVAFTHYRARVNLIPMPAKQIRGRGR